MLPGLGDRLCSRARFLAAFRCALLQFRTRGVALLHDHFQPVAIPGDLRLHPLHRLREKCRRRLLRIHASAEQRLEVRRVAPRALQFGSHDAIVGLKRVHLLLQIFERLAHVALTVLHARFDLLPHLDLCGLHVVRRVLLPPVRDREVFLRLQPRFLLAREFERRLLLGLLECLDAPVQLLDQTVGSHARPGCVRSAGLSSIFKRRDLLLQPIDLLLLRLEILVRAARDIGPDGDSRAALRDPVHRVLEIPAQPLALRERLLVRRGERLALTLEIHDLPLVVALEHRDQALHVHGQFAEPQIDIRRDGLRGRCRRGFGRSCVPREPKRGRSTGAAIRRRKRRRGGARPGRLRGRDGFRPVRAGLREPRSLLSSTAAPWQHAARLRGRRYAGAVLCGLLRAQLFGERRWRPPVVPDPGCTFRARHQLRNFLPRETDLDPVRLEHLGAENLRDPAVDLREVHHRDALRDPRRERRNLKPQFGLQIVRPGQQQLRRDAVQEIAEFEPDSIRWRSLLRRDHLADHGHLRRHLRRRSGSRPQPRHGSRRGFLFLFALQTVEKTHAWKWALRITWMGWFP